jgi:hypothetical protein
MADPEQVSMHRLGESWTLDQSLTKGSQSGGAPPRVDVFREKGGDPPSQILQLNKRSCKDGSERSSLEQQVLPDCQIWDEMLRFVLVSTA